MAQATLIDPRTGRRVAVETGSQQAQQLFGQGYVLEQRPGVAAPATSPNDPRLSSMSVTPPNISSGIRDLNLSGGSSLTLDQQTQPTQTASVPQGNTQSASQSFMTQLMSLLQQQQQLGTRQFQEQGFNAEEAQLKRINETPSNLIGANPSLQNQVRSASAGAIDPTIQGAQQSQKTFSEQIAGLGSAINQARAIGEWMQESERQVQQDARDLIFKLPSTVKGLPDEQKRELEKRAGLQKGLIDLLPDLTSDRQTQTIDVDGRKLLIDSLTGETIKDLGGTNTSLSNTPTSYDEWFLAGQPGTYADWLNKKSTKPPTEAERRAFTFYERAKDAENTISDLEEKIAGYGFLDQSRLQYLPNILQSSDNQLYRQAQRQFTEARLRKESGAAIADSEYEKDAQTYFAQPGDSKEVLARKKAARTLVVNLLKQEAGNAYKQSYGDETTPKPLPIRSNLDGTIRYLLQDGSGDTVDLTPEQYKQRFPNALSMAENGSVKKIAAAIKSVESGGNYKAKGGSGEFGAYQFMPSTWKSWAKQYLGNPNSPMTKENQDLVAERKIAELLSKGYGVWEIALIWNGGTPTVKKGTNKYGIKYDSGAYASKVLSRLG